MKPNQTYLKGKSVFIVSLIVVVVTALTVYFSGIHYNRSITTNFYMSLGIIAATLFLFLSYGLYKGIDLKDDFPKLKGFEFKNSLGKQLQVGNMSTFEVGEGIVQILNSLLIWLLVSVLLILLLILLETVVWFSIVLILAMLYWVFFRAVRLVFSKGILTEHNFLLSIVFALSYTILYVGWLFGIVYLATLFK
ncbi:hypothetical protein KORDIASMS9_00756 [Kordia sp. SMS9]|uniref:hypothetical protein n=1 Tax=Kordia sp. SMS9 TaxID=2282170 RepID=UPI000E0DB0D8|nr:hypothetical protein [Kordia sp. SMS9]AXG68541.1 hypothetical protein KORDIASMS9_00756 [Kordia sp. SMS9]